MKHSLFLLRPKVTVLVYIALMAFFVFSGCDNNDNDSPTDTTEDLRTRFNLQTLGAIPYPPDNPPRQERISLGRLLFYDPILGGEKDASCSTCHHPDFGFADQRQLAVGVSGSGLGPNRILTEPDRLHLVPRNAPTCFNTAFNMDENGQFSHLGFQFWDGRVNGLEEQATKPIGSRVEMAGDQWTEETALDSVVARLRKISEYVSRFRDAFPEEAQTLQGGDIINEDTYSRAMGAFERELVTRNSPYDRYVNGDDNALTDVQKKGLELFFTKAQCAECHSGAMFSDFTFVVQGVPQEGPGKAIAPPDDFGREEHTKSSGDRYAFRTPTLRNVELTQPYMHDGVLYTLEDVVRWYNDGGQPRHPAVTDAMLDARLKDSNGAAEKLGLTEDEIFAVAEFMRALTDNGTALDPMLMTVPEKVPSGLMPVFGVRGKGSGIASRQ